MTKIDPHIHLGGAIPTSFVWDAILFNGQRYVAESEQEVIEAMTFGPHEPCTFHRFLGKFNILDQIRWTPELIDRSIEAVCQSLIRNNVDYSWMRFSINKYMQYLPKWHRYQVIKFIYDCFEKHAPGRVGLVLSLKYESSHAYQRQLAELIHHEDVAQSVIGIDLVGDEAYFDPRFYEPLLKPWKYQNKLLFAHVGESQDAINIVTAADQLGVTEICHGVKAADKPALLDYAKRNDLCFHMALTSNKLTGVLDTGKPHPIGLFMANGNKVTIGTDDPIQCGTTLDHEFNVALDWGNLTKDQLDELRQNAIDRCRC